ncbi:hypothetical protein NDU88_003069 [Pleurodeles waltl]|uniref:Uncharacterized protein n=1 Tax=Pleurodeles waltl TaxID=8319 RepID=A0AAV7QBS1_PLEWA|nr:hypothetical protein NDU88_003069 [Pleurodeles waltl]
MEGQMGELKEDFVFIHQDFRNTTRMVKEIEGLLLGTEDAEKTRVEYMAHLQCQVGQLEARVEDAEGRTRHKTLRIVGIAEGEKGAIPMKFVYDWLQIWVPSDVLSNCFIVKIAHRELVAKPLVGAPLCPFIVKVLNYADKDDVLWVARRAGQVSFQSSQY